MPVNNEDAHLWEHHCSITIINDKLVLFLTVPGGTDNTTVKRTYVQPRRDRKLARSVTIELKCFMCVTEKQTLLSIDCLQTRHNRVV